MRPTCGSTRHLTEGQLCSTLPSHRYPNLSVGSGYHPVPPPTPSSPPPLLASAAAVAGSVFSQLRRTNRPTDRCLYVCVSAQTGVCASCFLGRAGRGGEGGSWAPVTMPPHTHAHTSLPSPRPLCATVTGLARGCGGGNDSLSTTDPPQNDSSDQRLTAAGVTQPDPKVNQLITHPRVRRLCHRWEDEASFFSFFRGKAKTSQGER